MEMILRLNETMRMHFPWRQIIAGVILAIFCTGLYIEVEKSGTGYSEYEVHKIESFSVIKEIENLWDIPKETLVFDKGTEKTRSKCVDLEEILPDITVSEYVENEVEIEPSTKIETAEKIETDTGIADVIVNPEGSEDMKGNMEIKVTVYGNGGTPEVAEYTFARSGFDLTGNCIPKRPGKIFDGWYLDSHCTEPFTGNIEDLDTLTVYAGWKDIPGFVTNEKGYITGYSDAAIVVADGVAVLPVNESCCGLMCGALDSLADKIFEIYIPANITYIESGAFDSLYNLMYIEVASGNPVYYSKGGILYSRSGGEVAVPCGW